ncbi:unnamed protein product [Amoebophrya sp. A25]|nr:unnamed protein product [Amoebophrya sp. A25]|eukprot:GSA25T00007206001.1
MLRPALLELRNAIVESFGHLNFYNANISGRWDCKRRMAGHFGAHINSRKQIINQDHDHESRLIYTTTAPTTSETSVSTSPSSIREQVMPSPGYEIHRLLALKKTIFQEFTDWHPGQKGQRNRLQTDKERNFFLLDVTSILHTFFDRQALLKMNEQRVDSSTRCSSTTSTGAAGEDRGEQNENLSGAFLGKCNNYRRGNTTRLVCSSARSSSRVELSMEKQAELKKPLSPEWIPQVRAILNLWYEVLPSLKQFVNQIHLKKDLSNQRECEEIVECAELSFDHACVFFLKLRPKNRRPGLPEIVPLVRNVVSRNPTRFIRLSMLIRKCNRSFSKKINF